MGHGAGIEVTVVCIHFAAVLAQRVPKALLKSFLRVPETGK